jgi:hypothetical protein
MTWMTTLRASTFLPTLFPLPVPSRPSQGKMPVATLTQQKQAPRINRYNWYTSIGLLFTQKLAVITKRLRWRRALWARMSTVALNIRGTSSSEIIIAMFITWLSLVAFLDCNIRGSRTHEYSSLWVLWTDGLNDWSGKRSSLRKMTQTICGASFRGGIIITRRNRAPLYSATHTATHFFTVSMKTLLQFSCQRASARNRIPNVYTTTSLTNKQVEIIQKH